MKKIYNERRITALRWSDDIVDWCGCSLPEAVQLANDRQSWRRVTGLNGSHGPWVDDDDDDV